MGDADRDRDKCSVQAGDDVLYYERVNDREECRRWILSINEEGQNVRVQIEGTINSLQCGDHIKVLCRRAADRTLRKVEVPFWETISSRTTIGRHTYTTGVVSRRNKGLRESMANAEKDIQDFNGVG